MDSPYDFVVVGSGPAGSAVAAGLARSAKKPSILLIEAGGSNEDHKLRVDGQRWQTFMNKDMNWNYQTVPQEHAHNRVLDYSRGLGLGGSSAINFGCYTVGARDDYDYWARMVGDDAFAWPHIQRRFKALETFHGDVPAGVDKKYASPKESDHGSSGPLGVGYAAEWERDVIPKIDVLEQAGIPLNPDHNSGNPLGISALINSSAKGIRSTARDLLMPVPENLTIVTSSPVQRVILDGKKAVGVESNGKKYFASKEVILSAGSLNDPQILMHSGIGPAEQLIKFGIPVALDAPAVGQGLRDHPLTILAYKTKEGSSDRPEFYGSSEAMGKAMDQWRKNGTGPWAKFGCELGVAWCKLDSLASFNEFQDLPSDEQAFLQKETVPAYELLEMAPAHNFVPGFPHEKFQYSCLTIFCFNGQGRGEVTLQSSDPKVPLLFDPKFLSSPFDRRVAIETLRAALQLTKREAYTQNHVAEILGPKSESDEDLLEYWRQTVASSWHMTGTVKMGKAGEEDAAVDSDFRLFGVDNLRVADMSVVPVILSGHTQTAAYVTGKTCAEKLAAEYDLA